MSRIIQSLTGLRGLAACYVAFYHVHGRSIDPTSMVGPLTRHGYIAVDLFFVLSGFVMTLSYQHLFERPDWRRYGVFMTRRAARIYPLYFTLTCVIMLGLQIGIGRRPEPPPSLEMAFLYNLLLVQNWGLSYSIIIASWSISTELAAYLVFPLLLAAAMQSRPAVAFATTLGATAALVAVALVPHDLPHNGPLDVFFDFSPWPMIRCLSEFTLGVLAFRLATGLQGRALPAALRPAVGGRVLLVAAMGLLCWPGTDLLLIVVFALLMVTIRLDEGPVAFWLANPFVVLLGDLSFAIYLLHWEFMRLLKVTPALTGFLGTTGGKIGADVFYFAGLIAAAWLCYNCIEKPGRRLVRHWARRIDVAPA